MTSKNELYTIRPFTPGDVSFIMATWLKGLRYGNDWFNLIPSNIYYKTYHDILEGILKNPQTEVRVAALKDDPDTILGYSVLANDTLHWVFVKSAWRKIGIARTLVPLDIIKSTTHLTKIGMHLLHKYSTITFNPFF